MADTKITDLTPSLTLPDNGVIPIASGTQNYKIPASSLLRPEKLLSEFDTAPKKQTARDNLNVYGKTEVYNQNEANNLLSTKATKEKNDPNGFWSASTEISLSWNEATRTLTVNKLSSEFSFFIRGDKYTKTVNESIQIPNTTGSYFIYYDLVSGVPTLQYQTSFSSDLILQKCYVAFVYWNATQSISVPDLQIETHGSSMSGDDHLYNHTTTGTAFVSGLTLSLDTTGTGSIDNQARFIGASGVIADEDLQHTITAKNILSNFPIIYRVGNEWRANKTLNFVTIKGTNLPYYNQNNAGTWQLTEMTNNKYGVIYIFVSPGITNKWFILMGQNQYDNVNSASDAAKLYPDLGNLPLQEFKLVGSAIFQASTTFPNTSKSALQKFSSGVDYYDWRKTAVAGQEASILSSDILNLSNQINTVNTTLSGEISALNTAKADKTTAISANNGLSIFSGGTLGQNTTISGVDASISAKGVVQLSNNEGTSETLAITPKGLDNFLIGANLEERIQDVIGSTIQNTNSIKFSYDDLNNRATLNLAVQNLSSDSVNLTIDSNGLKADIKSNSIVNADINTTAGIETSKINQLTYSDNTLSLVNGETLEVGINKIQYQAKDAIHKNTSGEINSLTAKTTIADADVFISENSANSFSKTKINASSITNYILSKDKNVKNLYLSGGSNGVGSDTNNGYSPNNAFSTLAYALTKLGNTGEALIFLPSQITESGTFSQLNIDVKGDNANIGAMTGTTGTLTSTNISSSQRYRNLTIGNFTKTGNGSAYLRDVTISSALTDTSSGFLEMSGGSVSNISLTGVGIKVIENVAVSGKITINNASLSVSIQGNEKTITLPAVDSMEVIAGTLSLKNVIIYCLANTVFGSSGINLICDNVKFINPSNGLAQTISIPSGVNYSLQNCEYAANSSILGNDISTVRLKRFGNINIRENLDVAKNVNIGQNLIVTGDLTVNGTTTTLDTVNVSIEDKNIEIGKVASPTDITANGGGITLKGTTDKTIAYNNSTQSWDISENINLPSAKTYKVNGVEIRSVNETLENKILDLNINQIKVDNSTINKDAFTRISTLTSDAQNQINGKQASNTNLTKLSSLDLANNGYKVITVNSASDNLIFDLAIKTYTTTERNNLASVPAGFVIINSTEDKIQQYDGSNWSNLISAGTGNVSANSLSGIATGELALFSSGNGTTITKIDGTASQRKVLSGNSKLIARFTTTEINSLTWVENDVVYNLTANKLLRYSSASTWVDANANVGDYKDVIDATEAWGWKICNSQAISRTDYPEAFVLLGTQFGEGNGSTTFNLPDTRGKVMGYIGSGTFTTSFLPSAINTSTDVITINSANALQNGAPVRMTTTGTLPQGIVSGTVYYVIRLTETTIELATSLSNAQRGVAFNFVTTGTGVGTGVHTLTVSLSDRILGEQAGEEETILTENQMPPHTHTINGDSGSGIGGNASTDRVLDNADGAQQNVFVKDTGSTGDDGKHNNMQPTLFGAIKQIFLGR
jgi:microcystin-dependent protein